MSRDYLKIRALILGVIHADSQTKQELGRRFAAHLGLKPGPYGSYDGIDGIAIYRGNLRKPQSFRQQLRIYRSYGIWGVRSHP